jgi:hypothetical protein
MYFRLFLLNFLSMFLQFLIKHLLKLFSVQNYMKISNFQVRKIKIKTTEFCLRPYFEVQLLSLQQKKYTTFMVIFDKYHKYGIAAYD